MSKYLLGKWVSGRVIWNYYGRYIFYFSFFLLPACYFSFYLFSYALTSDMIYIKWLETLSWKALSKKSNPVYCDSQTIAGRLNNVLSPVRYAQRWPGFILQTNAARVLNRWAARLQHQRLHGFLLCYYYCQICRILETICRVFLHMIIVGTLPGSSASL